MAQGPSDEAVRQIADATTFESFGEFDWHHDFNKERSLDARPHRDRARHRA
ncbi:MAG: hypothetical protein R3B96_08050 [Pirellulaceae bacterium]